MKVEIYIKSYYGISAIDNSKSIWPLPSSSGDLKVVEPLYEELLDIRSMRRLSKILKMGVFASMKCIHALNDTVLDGIISGTGLGCTADTYAFLDNLIKREEHLLTPTAFIQSTHNTLSGTLGIMLKNHGYNMTWSQRSFSFYKALEDAVNLLDQKSGHNYLVTGADEMPETIENIINKMDGCIGSSSWSEGAASFIISAEQKEAVVKLSSIDYRKTSEIDKGRIDAMIDPSTYVLNVNGHLNGFSHSDQILDLGPYIGEIFVNDAIAMSYGCSLLDSGNKDSIDFPYKKIICLGGDKKNTSLITLSKL